MIIDNKNILNFDNVTLTPETRDQTPVSVKEGQRKFKSQDKIVDLSIQGLSRNSKAEIDYLDFDDVNTF